MYKITRDRHVYRRYDEASDKVILLRPYPDFIYTAKTLPEARALCIKKMGQTDRTYTIVYESDKSNRTLRWVGEVRRNHGSKYGDFERNAYEYTWYFPEGSMGLERGLLKNGTLGKYMIR